MKKLKSYIALLRPIQWLKNLVVFLPMFLSKHICETQELLIAGLVFVLFCMVSSAVYCLNDICDREADILHPTKKLRPVASGEVPVAMAYVTMALLLVISFAASLIFLSVVPIIMLCIYFIMNILYSLKLKRYAIVDVVIISLGFVLRLFTAGTALHIWLSPWTVCLIFLLAMLLAFSKRRDDVCIMEKTGVRVRDNVKYYNLQFMNQTLGMIGAVLVICYIILTVSPDVEQRFDCEYIYGTSVFVLAGVLRYLQITIGENNSGDPIVMVLHDRFIKACVAGWIVVWSIIIYAK